MGDPQESSKDRQHEHAEAVEEILDSIDPALEEHAYPVNSEDLSARYAESVEGLPNETESLGSVFDRLEDDEYDSPMEVKEAVLREVSEASPEPTTAGADREPQPGGQGTPEEVLEDLESEEVAESAREGTPTDVESEAADVGTAADTASGSETDAAEPGDELAPETTEADEFAPQESVEDRDREGDRRASAERSSDRGDPWEGAAEDPGDPAEPTAEPTEAELDPAEREGDTGAPSEGTDAGTAGPPGDDLEEIAEEVDGEASGRARREGEDREPLEGTDGDETHGSEVPDARDEEPEVTREGNLPDEAADGDDANDE